MTFSEQEIRQIINEEIEKMVEEGVIDEGFLDTLRSKAGGALRGLAGGFGRAVGLKADDYADQEKASLAAAAKEKDDEEFMAGVERDTERKQEVEGLYKKIMQGLGMAEIHLDKLEDFSLNNQDIAKVRAAADGYSRAVEAFTEKILGHSLRESKMKKKILKRK